MKVICSVEVAEGLGNPKRGRHAQIRLLPLAGSSPSIIHHFFW